MNAVTLNDVIRFAASVVASCTVLSLLSPLMGWFAALLGCAAALLAAQGTARLLTDERLDAAKGWLVGLRSKLAAPEQV